MGISSSYYITAVGSNISCNGAANGIAAATVSGGTVPYSYLWIPGGQTTQTITGLTAGTYSVIVTDSAGSAATATVTITQPTAMSVTVSATVASCNNGSATVTATGGTLDYTYSWNPPVGGQTTATASGLPAGTYTATVTDANGCTKTQTVTVTANNTLSVSISSTQTECTVTNGTAMANASNGTSPYTYSWSNGQTTQTATELAVGNYTAAVTDANGCTQTQTVSITQTAYPVATVTATPTTITTGGGGNTQLTASGGETYSWTPSTGLNCSACSNPVATLSQTTDYCVFITDSNGCTDSACITINVELPCGTLFVPNAFSPNADGENDMECVLGNCIQTLTFEIYNRLGEKVFETTDPRICWDGMYKGKLMNTAVFVYYLNAAYIDGTKILKKGNISLIR